MRTLRLLLICLTAVFLAGCGEPDIRSKAEAGDPAAQSKLGNMYYAGFGVPKDAAEAVNWYRKAADQGYDKAQFNLGLMYELGAGVPQDYAEALKWYRKAADQGNAGAQFNIGNMYDHGQGVPKVAAEAYAWYNLASISSDNAGQKRDELEKTLTPEQKARAQQRSIELHKEIEERKKAAGK